MRVDFKVGQTPPSTEVIEKARERLEANIKLGAKAKPFVFVAAALLSMLGYFVVEWLIGNIEAGNPELDLAAHAQTLFVAEIFVLCIIFQFVISRFFRWLDEIGLEASLLEPLVGENFEKARLFAAQFPGTKSYLESAQGMRPLVNGDFFALVDFSEDLRGGEESTWT